MKIRVLSDLHLEHQWYDIPRLDTDPESILVLAGDIAPLMWSEKYGDHDRSLISFLVKCSSQFKYVVYVAGNHEFYDCFFDSRLETLKSGIDWIKSEFGIDNIFPLADDSVILDGYKFIGSTLWTDMQVNMCGIELMKHAARQCMSDYRYIYDNDGRSISPDDTIAAHYKSLQFIEQAFKNSDVPCILVTHHGISQQSVADHYKGNSMNGAFISELDELILDYSPLLAIHGHVHWGFDYSIGNTRVIVNPRGYPGEGNPFDPFLVMSIDEETNIVSREITGIATYTHYTKDL